MHEQEPLKLKELLISEFVIVPETKQLHIQELLSSSWVFILVSNPVKKVFRRIDLLQFFLSSQIESAKLVHLNCDTDFSEVIDGEEYNISFAESRNSDIAVLVSPQDRHVLGVVDNFRMFKRLIVETKRRLWQKDLQIEFFKSIFNVMEDDIFITDEYGFVQYMNPRGEQICQVKLEDYIGRHVTDMEKEGVISQSITMEVLRTGKRAEMPVRMSSGQLIMSIGLPVYDEKGKIRYVFSTSKVAKEINELLEKLAGTVQELDLKKKELEMLWERMANEKEYVFESKAMKQVRKIVSKVAPTDVSILIEGESGTGKEVVADLIYQCSNRHKGPMVKINCGLIPENLLESELFGYEAGAFTGADRNGKIGKIETANGGTVFFDEIGELPLSLQVKLLEFLQDRTITRVGGTKQIAIDVRVIAATNKDLKEMVNLGTFRSDLYYRLSVMPILLRPLAERQDDILPLVNMFLKRFNLQYNLAKRIDKKVLNMLYEYSWPGNVRELMHVIERLAITAETDTIDEEALLGVLNADTGLVGNVICTGIIPLKQARSELEGILVRGAYKKYGTSYRAAEALGVNQSTVVRILRKTNMENAKLHEQ